MPIVTGIDRKKLTFGLIGIFNTLLDLVLYVAVYSATDSIIASVIVANTAALIGSYILNSRFTFKTRQWTLQSFALFIGVTVFGVWVLQSGIIYLISPLLQPLWASFGSFANSLHTIVPKLIATIASFTWNYVWYSRVIFKRNTKQEQALIALEKAS